jgi:hypothetical protein
MSGWRALLLTGLLAFVAALAGVVAGRALVPAPAAAPETELHALLHGKLDLDAGQRQRLDTLNRDYYARKNRLEAEMRAQNAALAQAIAREHGYGPQVAAAVDRSHHVMGALQKATLEHVFAMRAILRTDQTGAYDAAVAKALTAPAP